MTGRVEPKVPTASVVPFCHSPLMWSIRVKSFKLKQNIFHKCEIFNRILDSYKIILPQQCNGRQGGAGIEKKDPGSIFLLRRFWLD